ncbi:IPP transferase [Planctomycetes bacterium Pla163]|uniref:tRNA dimethylallyltransferase n=1 Tax=Rohdeia mirabilis TaxID=2528008 RepID=A0A518D1J6_9BACT|nr:IPP transferase [Planctomycetes bacterium Pla163]
MSSTPPAHSLDPASTSELLFVVGPTASGKTELGVELARAHGLEICSLDSMLVYRGMDLGTAKPDAAERRGVPHHLIDLIEPSERYDVQRYVADAARELDAIAARGKRALFVGGTGLYLQVLVQGLFAGPAVDVELRAELERRAASDGALALHAALARVDPELAAKLHPNDVRRVIRGLEVHEQSGRPLSSWQEQWSAARRPARIVGIEPPRELHAERVAARTQAMLEAGWIDEVRAIRGASGFGPTACQALGYAEILAYLDGTLVDDRTPVRDEVLLAALIARRTRQFARRQRTWYRRFDTIDWVPFDASPAERVEHAARALGLV